MHLKSCSICVNPHQTAAQGLYILTDTLFKLKCWNTSSYTHEHICMLHIQMIKHSCRQTGREGLEKFERGNAETDHIQWVSSTLWVRQRFNKTWTLEKKALLLIQQLVTNHDILRDSTPSSELSLGKPFPLHLIDYIPEPSNMVPILQHTRYLSEGQADRYNKKLESTYALTSSEQ